MVNSLPRVRKVALALIAFACYSIARPQSAEAAPRGSCGVCYSTFWCGGDPSGDCQSLCGSSVASSCVNGIPGGWTCLGGGTYSSFVYCGLEE